MAMAERQTADSSHGGAERLRSFGPLRMLAAVHFMTFHFPDMKARHNFCRWGGSWNPMLFALAGFVLTRSQLGRQHPADLGTLCSFMRRRLARVYPLYLVSLVLLLPFTLSMNPLYLFSLPLHVLLMQSWFAGQPTHIHLQWNGNAWFVSNLVVHWFCWWFAYPRLRDLSASSCWRCLGGVAIIALARMQAVARYYTDGHYRDVQFVYANPLMNLHLFFSGAVLARLLEVQRDAPQAAPATGRPGGACAALGGLLLLFHLAEVPADEGYHAIRAFAPCGVLLPLQLLLIWSLARGQDPLARLWQHRSLAWTDRIYFEFYMLQYLCLLQGQRFLTARKAAPVAGFFAVILPASLGCAWLARRCMSGPRRCCLCRRRLEGKTKNS